MKNLSRLLFSDRANDWASKVWVLLLFVLVGSVVFGPFLANPFLMDDEIQILGNTHIQTLSHWTSFFTHSTMGSGGGREMGGIYYKPLMTCFYALAWHFGGAQPIVFRVPILLLHVSNAWMLFLFLSEFFSLSPCFWAGLIFLVHPINSEIVAYIADVQDVLFFFWTLIALLCAQRIENKAKLFWVLVATYALGLLSKESGVLALGIVPLYLFLFRRRLAATALSASALVSIVYFIIRMMIGLSRLVNPLLHISNATFGERLLTAPVALWHYLEVAVFPYRLSTITDFALSEPTLDRFWLPLAGILVFIICLALLGRSLGHRREKMNIFYLAVGMLLAWWALHGNVLVPLDGTYADRWFYLACLPCLMLAILWLEKRSIAWNSKLVVSLGCLVTIALSVRTAVRLDDWCHPIELYRRETAFHPWDAIMTNNVGVELFRSGNIQDSAEYFQRASQLNPIWDVAWNNQGAVAQRLGQAGQALALYEHAVSLGTYSLAYENYAGLLLATGQLDRCRDFLGQKALRIFPENPSLLATAHQLGM